MEMVRTFIIALFFAAITVGTYYFLNNPDVSWDFLASKEEKKDVPAVMIEETPGPEVSHTDRMNFQLGVSSPDAGMPIPPMEATPAMEPVPDFMAQTMPPPTVEPAAPPSFWDEVGLTPPNEAAASAPAVQTVPIPQMEPSPIFTPEAPAAVPAYVSAPPPPLHSPQAPQMTEQEVRAFLAQAAEALQVGNYKEVLEKLSPCYGDPRLTQQESEMLTEILTKAATWAIFDKNQHILEPPYVVRPGDTLEAIAAAYRIPVEFIARVNGLSTAMPLQAGTQLKVLRGPFHANVFLDRYEMLLTLNGLFAVRFWIGVGNDLTQPEGSYVWGGPEIADYRGVDQTYILARDPGNPLGEMQYRFVNPQGTDTGGFPQPGVISQSAISIHASPEASAVGRRVARGNIILSRTDLESLGVLLGRESAVSLYHRNPHAANMQMASPAQTPSAVSPEGVLSPVHTSMGQSVSMPDYHSPVDEMPGAPVVHPATAPVAHPVAVPGYDMPPATGGDEFKLPATMPF